MFSSWILRDELMPPDWRGFVEGFEDETPIVGRRAAGYPSYNAPRRELLEDGVGGCLHEVGHMLGLFHHIDAEPSRNVMYQGFRRLRGCIQNNRFVSTDQVCFSEESAAILATSPFINPSVRLRSTAPPRVAADVTPGGSLTLRAQDPTGIQLVFLLKATSDRSWVFDRIVASHNSPNDIVRNLYLSLDDQDLGDMAAIAVNLAGERGFFKFISKKPIGRN